MDQITIHPSRYRAFGSTRGCTFCLVTDRTWRDRFTVEDDGEYDSVLRVDWPPATTLGEVVRRLPEPAHVLVINPAQLVTSPTPEQVGERKLICLPCSSTPMPFEALTYYVSVVESTDPVEQERLAEHVFELLEGTDLLLITDESASTTATFRHLEREYAWNQQAGMVDWGEQQIAPSGELSVLPADVMGFDDTLRLDIDGELALRGWPIVHGGSAPFAPEEQQLLYERLSSAAEHAVVLTVKGGEVTDHRPSHPSAGAAAAALDDLFAADARYRILWEVGFGINTSMDVLPDNRSMNEVYGAREGVVHLGVGLTPYTTYAPIFICPGSTLRTADGRFILGRRARQDQSGRLARTRSSSCGCR